MVTNARTDPGDSGIGIFDNTGTLIGVHNGRAEYQAVDAAGGFWGDLREESYETPVWPYADWIRQVIQGEITPPAPPAPRPEPTRDPAPGDPVMSLPPQPACPPNATGSPCTSGGTWTVADLLGSGTNRGTDLALCASPSCAFNGRAITNGSLERLPIGTSAGGYAPREVIVVCKSNASVPGAVNQQTVRVIFTNLDHTPSPIGMGWWDVTPDQVGLGATTNLIVRDTLSPC